MRAINVFREMRGVYELVGSLAPCSGGASFAYAASYLAEPGASAISLSLPLREQPFSEHETAPFFSGLTPEGGMRRLFAEAARTQGTNYLALLESLNNESVGGLVLGTSDALDTDGAFYEPMSREALQQLAKSPRKTALDLGMRSRLSLAGAQTKAGLYHTGDEPCEGWFVPQGAAPSTHIVKVGDDAFDHETTNEALCLETARACGFDVANFLLIPIDGAEPLLAIERFDRIVEPDAKQLGGLALPRRLHQEDFAQASGALPDMKYEPTGGHYLSRCADVIQRSSTNPFGERAYFLQALFLDYLLGNCDNHLKNHSMLWDEHWGAQALSPLYDLVCTTLYPSIYLEMGVSLCPSRRIDDVQMSDILASGKTMGIPKTMTRSLYREVWGDLLPALEKAEAKLATAGFPAAHIVADHIRAQFKTKVVPEA